MYAPKNGGVRILSRGWRAAGRLVWSPDGREVWYVAATSGGALALRAVGLSGASERIVARTPGFMLIHDVARDGRVLAVEANSRIALFRGGEGDKEERDHSWLDTSFVYDITVDGKGLLFLELSSGDGRNPAVYFRKSFDEPAVRLGSCLRPSLSPDSKWVACIHVEGAASKLMLLPVGAGESRQLTNEGFRYDQVEWLPDGRGVLFTASQDKGSVRSFVQAADGGPARPVTPEGVELRRVSPDGKRAISIRNGSVYVHDLQTGAGRKLAVAGAPGEFAVRWCADGRSFFTAVRDGTTSFLVYRRNAESGERTLWKKLRPPDTVGVTMSSLTVTADGRSYAYSFQRDLSDLFLITGLR